MCRKDCHWRKAVRLENVAAHLMRGCPPAVRGCWRGLEHPPQNQNAPLGGASDSTPECDRTWVTCIESNEAAKDFGESAVIRSNISKIFLNNYVKQHWQDDTHYDQSDGKPTKMTICLDQSGKRRLCTSPPPPCSDECPNYCRLN